jgi:hypothetical protein
MRLPNGLSDGDTFTETLVETPGDVLDPLGRGIQGRYHRCLGGLAAVGRSHARILQPGQLALQPQNLLSDLAQFVAQGQRRHDQQATVADFTEASAQLGDALIEIGRETLQMPFLSILACHAVLATRDGDGDMRHDDLP